MKKTLPTEEVYQSQLKDKENSFEHSNSNSRRLMYHKRNWNVMFSHGLLNIISNSTISN